MLRARQAEARRSAKHHVHGVHMRMKTVQGPWGTGSLLTSEEAPYLNV